MLAEQISDFTEFVSPCFLFDLLACAKCTQKLPCNQNNWYFILGVTVLSAVVRGGDGSFGELKVKPLIGLKEVPCRFRNTEDSHARTRTNTFKHDETR